MLKTYEKYLIKSFINKFFFISLIFFSLILILSALEEISFFKKAFASSISGSSQPRKNLLMLINTLFTGFVPQVNKAR